MEETRVVYLKLTNSKSTVLQWFFKDTRACKSMHVCSYFSLSLLPSPAAPHQLHRVVGIIFIKTQFFIKYLHPHQKTRVWVPLDPYQHWVGSNFLMLVINRCAVYVMILICIFLITSHWAIFHVLITNHIYFFEISIHMICYLITKVWCFFMYPQWKSSNGNICQYVFLVLVF